MRRAVERYLEDPMAEELLRGNIKAGDTVNVSAVDGKMVFHVPEKPLEDVSPVETHS
jgi:ATP-dependent Clp protease ATP-binding subunit ClpC